MRKAAEPAETRRGFLEIDIGEGVSVGAVGLDAESIEKGAADQMRRFTGHRPDPQIYARFAEIHPPHLRIRVGPNHDSRHAAMPEIVDARVIGCAREPRQRGRKRGRAREFEKVPAADGHAMSPRLKSAQCISSAFQASFSLVAW